MTADHLPRTISGGGSAGTSASTCAGIVNTAWGHIKLKVFQRDSGWEVTWRVVLSAQSQVLLEGSNLEPFATTTVNGRRINNFTGHEPEPFYYEERAIAEEWIEGEI